MTTKPDYNGNIVKILEDSDFQNIRKVCNNHDGWIKVCDKKNTKLYTMTVDDSHFPMYKVITDFEDVDSCTAYDVLQDNIYRKKWDKYMIESKDVGVINPNTDVCYYAIGSVAPFRSRDFIMQRSWLDNGKEKFILSHSICHKNYPPTTSHIRGNVHVTAYYITLLNNGGSRISYVTHSDPKGKLPGWFVNRITKTIAPKILKKLHKVCLEYPDWKAKNQPSFKPWLFPEQVMHLPRINLEDCLPQTYSNNGSIVDESDVKGTSIDEGDQN
uniref:START domain-containing protein n=1 Tax=Rhabditophanes sp. KR3021 TaxID=114890 RepID=A0AC35U0R3_9BILA